MNKDLFFQYCQKIVLLNEDKSAVLLAQRKGESDYNNTYSFIGGKMESSDESFINGLTREKNEEVGKNVKIKVLPDVTINALFNKKDGTTMVLPHYIAIYKGGEVQLSNEYSNYKWVDIDKLDTFEPIIDTVPKITKEFLNLLPSFSDKNFVEI